MPGPQLDHVPFLVTITARDASNAVATSFNGAVQLSAVPGGGRFSGTLLGLPPNGGAQVNHFSADVGNTFIPAVDIDVTHVVHYFGNKVTIATGDGAPLLAQAVNSTPGTWVESPLQQTLRLTAGRGYRVTTFLPADAQGYRRIGLANPFPHGTLGAAVLALGLSQNPDTFGYWMVDLRYSPVTSAPVATLPANTGTFSNGVWTGEVAMLAPATNAVLAADDGDGHTGLANGIDVRYGNDLLIFVQASPEPVPIGGALFYTITVTNTGPAVATNVVVSDVLPNAFTFLSANGTLGTCSFANGTVTCVMPAVPRGAIALVGIAVRPEAVITDFDTSVNQFRERPVTNVVSVTRDGPDGHLLNNSAQVVTRVLRPTVNILDTTVREGNGDIRSAVFEVRLSYPTTEEVYVGYSTFSQSPTTNVATATPQIDYVVTYGSLLLIAPGETNSTIRVPILGDSIVEPDETIFLYFYENYHATTTRDYAVATILDDDALPGQVDHFDWAPISSPQFVNDPFAVTLTAKNAAGATVSNFTGPPSLSGMTPVLGQTNLLVKNDPHFSTGSFGFDTSLGYSFVPRTNILVTHVRRYFGDHVSIWSSNGLLLARQSFAGPPGTWSEAALPAPLVLLADVSYRISTRAPAGTVFYLGSFGFDYFPHGNLEAGYRGLSDAFPEQFEGSPRYMVGLNYALGPLPAVPLSPAGTTAFTNGVWTGLVSVGVPATNLVLRADDGDGSVGEANPITVQLHNDVAVTAAAAQVPADIRSNFTYTIAVTNTGPSPATGVLLTNMLPAEVNLVSQFVSQGSALVSGRTITCSLGTLAASGTATLTLTCKPVVDGIVLTNVAGVGRAESDAYAANNSVTLATPVRSFRAGAVAILGAERDADWREDVRSKIESSGFFTRVVDRPVYFAYPVPTLDELQEYSAVFAYSDNRFNDIEELGNVLADYVDAGFGVVMAADGFATDFGIEGRLVSEHYLPFGQGDFSSGQNLTLIANEPQHPLLEGVNSFKGGSGSYHEAPLGLNPGATLVAHWSNGEPLVGAKHTAGGRTVGLNLFPMSSDLISSYWNVSSDGALLMANALRWASAAPPPLPDDLALSLTQFPGSPRVGETITYTLRITNSGPSSAHGVLLTNILPPGVVLVSLLASQGTVTNRGAVVFGDLGTIPGGAQATIIISAQSPVSVRLTNTASITRSEADAYLRNNRAFSIASVRAPVLTVTDAAPVTEGNVGTNAAFMITLSFSPPQNVFVPFATLAGSAQAGSDFIPTNGTLVFVPGETNKELRVSVVADNIREDEENFFLQLLGATNATLLTSSGMATIVDDDPLPVVDIGDASVIEGDAGTTALTFNLTLTPASGGFVDVFCAISNGTASANNDYVPQNFSLFFPRGVTNQTVVVRVIGDRVPEPDETFTVHIYDLAGATLGRGVATGTIVNDDGIAGRLDHFDWSPIPPAQLLYVPFPVTITARDSFGGIVNTFAGPLVIHDGYPTLQTNTFFQNRTHSFSGQTVAELTLAYAVTPITDLLVTHVRSYFGDKVSIWTDTGDLVVSQAVFSTPTVWRETQLPAPVTLRAGTRYRVSVHKTSSMIYYEGGPELVPEIGYFFQGSYSTFGDAFPAGSLGISAPMVDLRYISALSPRFSPPATGLFTNGAWAGQITAWMTTNNVQLGVDDLLGHSGFANPITILPQHDLSVGAGPNPIPLGATQRLFITIRNQGTNPATGVTITHVLPAGVNLLSVAPSQGTFVNAGGIVTCNVGTLPADAMATVTLLVRPTAEGTLTNVTSAGRNEPSPDAGHVVITLVQVATNSQAAGFFTDGNENTTSPAGVISRAGLIPIHLPDIANFDLNAIRILFVNEFQLPPTPALQQRLPAIESWVRGGGVLVLHNGYFGNVPYFGSLLMDAVPAPTGFFTFVRATPPADTLVTTGPFGTLATFDVQGQMSLALQYASAAIETASLPAGAKIILDLPVIAGYGPVAAFSHPLGQGHVYYSSVPLDYYLELPDARAVTNIYAPNVVAYAQALLSMTATNVPGIPQFILSPGTTGWTPNGGFQFQIGGLSGHGEVVISASSNLLDWVPVFTNPPVNGTIQFLDTGATNKSFRFYRLEER